MLWRKLPAGIFRQNFSRHMTDTIYFINEAKNADFEVRELLLKYLKLGLALTSEKLIYRSILLSV
jgi:hypothetical protein